MIQAPTIQFDRNHRAVVAEGTLSHPVQTTLVESEKSSLGERWARSQRSKRRAINSSPSTTPITITASKLTYADV